MLSEADRVRGARIARRYAARSPSAALCTSSVDKSLILQRTCTRPHADVSQVDWLRMECYRQDRGASRLSASLSPSPLCSETPLEILNKIDRDAATAADDRWHRRGDGGKSNEHRLEPEGIRGAAKRSQGPSAHATGARAYWGVDGDLRMFRSGGRNLRSNIYSGFSSDV